MIRVRFHRAASTEAEAAVRWYNERVPGLGDDIRGELIAAVFIGLLSFLRKDCPARLKPPAYTKILTGSQAGSHLSTIVPQEIDSNMYLRLTTKLA